MKKSRLRKRIVIIAFLAVVSIIGFYFYFQYSTYENIEIVKTYENESADNGNYLAYLDGVLKYSKDGIAMFNKNGEEVWNQPCQMSRPIAEICDETAAVADKDGTSILVFQKSGLKGEIQTTKPISKIAVSKQGIVAAILQDESTPRVMCYDAKGNVLVEHKASLTNTGYPIDIAISYDGNVLLVSYLCTTGNSVTTKVVFYNFGEDGVDKENYQVAQMEYQNTIIPITAFIDEDTSLLVADNALILCEGLEEPKESKVIELDKEIKSIVYNEKKIALVLKNTEETGYTLCMYDTNGNQVMSTQFEGEYTNIKISKEQIILYSGNTCAIFNTRGICKYQGTLENNIVDLYSITGLNKYMMISTNGFSEIQLVK